MHYLITGATGLIGTTLCRYLLSAHHTVTVLTRSKQKAFLNCGHTIQAVEQLSDIADEQQIDAVINLAGAPIADARWTPKRKRLLEQSRIGLTQDLVAWLTTRSQQPECLISGSAVGWYGDGGSSRLTEQSGASEDYAHDLCQRWEQAALAAETLGVRVCLVRTGLVLAPNGGFLKKMLLPFKLGFGGKIGSGEQFMPWIHIHDIANLFIFLSQRHDLNGTFNGTAPMPATNSSFTSSLAAVLHRPSLFTIPSCFLELMLGEMSALLLTGQNAIPEKARAAGFQFEYTDLKSALINVTQQH